MKINILFPQDPFGKNKVDSVYDGEFNACKLMNIKSYYYDYDELVNEDVFLSDIDDRANGVLIYRGWMLKPEQYKKLYDNIIEKTNGYLSLINSPEQYTNCHCFPYIYDDIKRFTPKIVVFDKWDYPSEIYDGKELIDFDFFLKDYVKSTKTDKGIERIPKNTNIYNLFNKMKSFIEERSSLFTIGVVAKEFVDLKKINNYTNEWRAFYLFGDLIDLTNNSEVDTSNGDKPLDSLVVELGDILSSKSNFFTVDFALTEDNKWIVIETGDGCVSGLSPHCNDLVFYNKIANYDYFK